MFRRFEKPEGWHPGQPEVLVAENTIDVLGMPVVDYNSLAELNQAICQDKVPQVILEGTKPGVKVLGHAWAYSPKVHVNAVASEDSFPYSDGTVRVLAHEMRHFSDSANHPVRTGMEVAVGLGAAYAASVIARKTIADHPVVGLAGGLLAVGLWKENDPAEKRAYETESTPAVKEHGQAILFPVSPRTEYLLHDGQLDMATIAKLGLDKYIQLARDYRRPSVLASVLSRLTGKA